jgi:hypothetical protein
MPMVAAPFGPERTVRDAYDASSLAEDIVAAIIERSYKLEVDPGDVAALVALDLIASIAAYGRAPLAITLAVLAAAAPTREMLLRAANARGETPPPLNVAKLTAIAPSVCRLH